MKFRHAGDINILSLSACLTYFLRKFYEHLMDDIQLPGAPVSSKFTIGFFYPSSYAWSLLEKRSPDRFNNQSDLNLKELSIHKFQEISDKYENIFSKTENFDDDWLKSFIMSTVDVESEDISSQILTEIYDAFYDVLTSHNSIDYELFLKLTETPKHIFKQLHFCRVYCLIKINTDINVTFNPNDVKALGPKELAMFHHILSNHNKRISNSLIKLAISFYLPRSIIHIPSNSRKLPGLFTLLPEPYYIISNYEYYTDSIFDFFCFILQVMHEYIVQCINVDCEKDDNVKKQIFYGLIDVLTNYPPITGAFLHNILFIDRYETIEHKHMSSENEVNLNNTINNFTYILQDHPYLRLFFIAHNQHLYSFKCFYRIYKHTLFHSENNGLFFNFDNEILNKSIAKVLSPYFSSNDGIMPATDFFSKKATKIKSLHSMLMRVAFEEDEYFKNIEFMQLLLLNKEMSTLCEEILVPEYDYGPEVIQIFSLISLLYTTLSHKDFVQKKPITEISVLVSVKALNYIFSLPNECFPTEHMIYKKEAYKNILNFLKINPNFYPNFLDSTNIVTNLFSRWTILRYINVKLQNMPVYFYLTLRCSGPKHFKIASKFLRSLTLDQNDVNFIQGFLFSYGIKDPLIEMNLYLHLFVLIKHYKKYNKEQGFIKLFEQGAEFTNFMNRINNNLSLLSNSETTEVKIAYASIHFLSALFETNQLNKNKFIELRNIELAFDYADRLNINTLKSLLILVINLCQTYDLASFPYKIRDFLKLMRYKDTDEIIFIPTYFLHFLMKKYPSTLNAILDQVIDPFESSFKMLLNSNNDDLNPEDVISFMSYLDFDFNEYYKCPHIYDNEKENLTSNISFLNTNNYPFDYLITTVYYKLYLMTDAHGNPIDIMDVISFPKIHSKDFEINVESKTVNEKETVQLPKQKGSKGNIKPQDDSSLEKSKSNKPGRPSIAKKSQERNSSSIKKEKNTNRNKDLSASPDESEGDENYVVRKRSKAPSKGRKRKESPKSQPADNQIKIKIIQSDNLESDKETTSSNHTLSNDTKSALHPEEEEPDLKKVIVVPKQSFNTNIPDDVSSGHKENNENISMNLINENIKIHNKDANETKIESKPNEPNTISNENSSDHEKNDIAQLSDKEDENSNKIYEENDNEMDANQNESNNNENDNSKEQELISEPQSQKDDTNKEEIEENSSQKIDQSIPLIPKLYHRKTVPVLDSANLEVAQTEEPVKRRKKKKKIIRRVKEEPKTDPLLEALSSIRNEINQQSQYSPNQSQAENYGSAHKQHPYNAHSDFQSNTGRQYPSNRERDGHRSQNNSPYIPYNNNQYDNYNNNNQYDNYNNNNQYDNYNNHQYDSYNNQYMKYNDKDYYSYNMGYQQQPPPPPYPNSPRYPRHDDGRNQGYYNRGRDPRNDERKYDRNQYKERDNDDYRWNYYH